MSLYRSPLKPLDVDTAEGESKERLTILSETRGRIPNMYGIMAQSLGLLATYLDGVDRFRAESGFTPAEQDTVFLTVSRFFECTYCMAAHSFIADHVSKTPLQVTDAIRNDEPIADEHFAALVAMVRELLTTQGRPYRAVVGRFTAAGYTDRQVLDIILAIALKTLSNWTNHVFDTELEKKFIDRRWVAPSGR
jgi:AhpD family alkylhydroperoxidase